MTLLGLIVALEIPGGQGSGSGLWETVSDLLLDRRGKSAEDGKGHITTRMIKRDKKRHLGLKWDEIMIKNKKNSSNFQSKHERFSCLNSTV